MEKIILSSSLLRKQVFTGAENITDSGKNDMHFYQNQISDF